jgi:hypothetical protein
MNRNIGWSVLAVTLCGSAVFAEEIYVKAASINVFSDEGSYYPVVGHATKGAALPVVSHDGHWVQVQVATPPVQGYVFDDALQATQPPLDVFNGVPVTPLVTSASAGRTLQPGALEYAQSKNVDPKALEALEGYNAALDPKEFLAFARQGQVGIGQAKH